jgi:hypothetical protein
MDDDGANTEQGCRATKANPLQFCTARFIIYSLKKQGELTHAGNGLDRGSRAGVSDFLCLSHTLDQEAEYGDQEGDFG